MSFARDALYGLYGAWRLARFDAGGGACYDPAPEAALRSFRALWLVLPGSALLLLLQLGGSIPPVMLASRLVLEGLAMVVGMLAYLLVAYHALELAGLRGNFGRYAGAYNWSYVIQVAVLLVVNTVVDSGLPGAEAAEMLQFATFVWVIVYQWFIATAAAGIGRAGAVGLVAVDVFITVLVRNLTDIMIGVPAA